MSVAVLATAFQTFNFSAFGSGQSGLSVPAFPGIYGKGGVVSREAGYTLFSGHRTEYSIVLGPGASESERWVAGELRHWLYEISGADFPIRIVGESGVGNEGRAKGGEGKEGRGKDGEGKEGEAKDRQENGGQGKGPQGNVNTSFAGPGIFVGYSSLTKETAPADRPADADESFHYWNRGRDILIVGGSQRGTLYGVMSFLENEFGCRWYTPSVSLIPRKEEAKFMGYDHAESPGIRVRNDFYFEAFDTTWAARNRMNGRMGVVSQPGGVETYGNAHTFYPLVPPEEFFGKHPEYYSLIDGKRTHDRAQLCLTNPAVLRIVTERIKKRMRDDPGYLVYDVSQNDNFNPCQCDRCQRIVKEEGSESGPVIWFVNQVAAAVEKDYPDKFIGTLAYQYTRKPPRNIHPRRNVIVRLCPFEVCSAHDLQSCPENQAFMSDLLGWSSLAPHLYIWDYVVNFHNYIIPYPNFNVLQPNIRTFRENHAIGVMEEAAYQSRGGEFAELKTYVLARLLWNPDADTREIIDDFMAGYYGRSGRYVRAYFDLLQGRITPAMHMHNGMGPTDSLFTDELVTRSLLLFEKAKIVADDDSVLRRVELASLPVLYLYCARRPADARRDGSFDLFKRIVEREGVTHFREGDDARAKKEQGKFYEFVENAK
ncbi:MAG: DUF4838 domain-containing protein [Puia sp.]|nr:DUF4838 domain-containing protein [Puia sp.]